TKVIANQTTVQTGANFNIDGSGAIGGNLTLAAASSASAGTIMKGANTFIHNFGVNNLFIGVGSGNFTSTGTNSIAVGNGALLNNTTGSRNIAIGTNAGLGLTTGDFNIIIGHAGVAGDSATIRIGDSNQARAFIAGIRGVTTTSANAVPVLIDSNGQLGTAG